MVDFMKWALTDGQKFAGELGLLAAAGERREDGTGSPEEDQDLMKRDPT